MKWSKKGEIDLMHIIPNRKGFTLALAEVRNNE